MKDKLETWIFVSLPSIVPMISIIMKRLVGSFFLCTVILLFISCTSTPPLDDIDEPGTPPTGGGGNGSSFDFSAMHDRDILPIYYSEDEGRSFPVRYEAVKIGEYLWMNSNFTAPVEAGHGVTQEQINTGLEVYRINTQKYKLTPDDLNKYFGQYYTLDEIFQMNAVGNMYEGDDKVERGKWGLPTRKDFQQLFAMCGNGNESDVRTTLVYKLNEIPIVQETENIFWMNGHNTNRYGFNLLYGGERAHNDGFSWQTCFDYPNDCNEYTSKKGDFVIFYATAAFPTGDNGTVILHDYPDTSRGKEWAWKPVRWTRRLTDKELGYKLYVNADRSDIVKLGIENASPTGYEELPNGYLRGFYVQYILNNPNPAKTVKELRQMELNITEVMHGAIQPT